ncbi:linker for activation of T-cells family member 2 isoform X2 [Strigops habroptila]|uniref:linker for activation of T-cells family member 2 isoform X2 n=1 Tax=Strigops habroptila TaxID=2489341 RepID=UPI0011CFD66A|nr:linker for activation of T-cells family member 2 isoform X2 [Strigops habroptila]
MAQLELLWAAAALMLLGAAVSLCVKCQLSATKREKQLNERRSQLRSQQSFEVIRSHSAMTRRLEQIKEPENLSIVRKTTKELGATRHAGYGSRAESRYRDFLTEDCLQGEAAYVEPISLDYYNCATFFTPPNGLCVIALWLEASAGPGDPFIKGCSGAVVLEGCPSTDHPSVGYMRTAQMYSWLQLDKTLFLFCFSSKLSITARASRVVRLFPSS